VSAEFPVDGFAFFLPVSVVVVEPDRAFMVAQACRLIARFVEVRRTSCLRSEFGMNLKKIEEWPELERLPQVSIPQGQLLFDETRSLSGVSAGDQGQHQSVQDVSQRP
jgi:hypothetical protein